MKSTRLLTLLTLALALTVVVTGCAKPKGDTKVEKQAYVQNMADEALSELYRLDPSAKAIVESSAGYAVFETVQTQVIITSTGNGYGIVHNNRSGKEYYMSSLGLGGGLGVGIKSQRAVMVFENEQVLNKFVYEGWTFGASGTATAKAASDKLDAAGETKFNDGILTYTMTENGLMAGVVLSGGKVWQEKKLK